MSEVKKDLAPTATPDVEILPDGAYDLRGIGNASKESAARVNAAFNHHDLTHHPRCKNLTPEEKEKLKASWEATDALFERFPFLARIPFAAKILYRKP